MQLMLVVEVFLQFLTVGGKSCPAHGLPAGLAILMSQAADNDKL